MRDASPDGAPVPDGRVADVAKPLQQERTARADHLGALRVSLPRHRPDRDSAVPGPYPGEPLHPTEVDHSGGHRHAHVEKRHQALTTGEDHAVVRQCRAHVKRLVQRGRRVVVEQRGFHGTRYSPRAGIVSRGTRRALTRSLPLSERHSSAAIRPSARLLAHNNAEFCRPLDTLPGRPQLLVEVVGRALTPALRPSTPVAVVGEFNARLLSPSN